MTGSEEITGLAMGAIATLGFMLTGLYMILLRRNKAKEIRSREERITHTDDVDSAAIDLGTAEPLQGYMGHTPSHHELPAPVRAPDLRSEHTLTHTTLPDDVKANAWPLRLPSDSQNHQPALLTTTNPHLGLPPPANRQTTQNSPHVEARKRRELEWLEMEEVRLRNRRETLMKQGRAGLENAESPDIPMGS